MVWGNTKEVEGSSDLYAVQYPNDEIHPVFKNFNDWVLLIHEGEKKCFLYSRTWPDENKPICRKNVSRKRMKTLLSLKNILKTGDLEGFIKLTEHEALTLHAMMMMSDPAFILMKTGTLEVINKIWDFRRITGLPLFFTLDAGANVHLLFPNDIESDKIKIFIQQELLPFYPKRGSGKR